ncbi:MAG: purine-binding chemotaxis protein CheW [Nitrospirae bacterium]|nr:purine-binding chemotaxis protein CheW [Nitrospirota bacterium]
MESDFKVLHFRIQDKNFSLPLSGIVEIIYFKPPMEVPQLKKPFKGVIDLRDVVIPIIDLRNLLELTQSESGSPDHILIIKFKSTLMGLIVDKVKDVLYLNSSHLQAASFENKEEQKFLKGIFKHQGELIMLLDIQRILDLETYEMANQGV